jgi:putative oxidoreductase
MVVNLGWVVLRIILGGLMLAHGVTKFLPIFGGHRFKDTAGFMRAMGFRPASFWAFCLVAGETLGGLAMAFGFLTPLAALVLCAVMWVAIAKVHASKGLWAKDGGYEFNLLILAACVAFALAGAGAWSVDAYYNVVLPYAHRIFAAGFVVEALIAAGLYFQTYVAHRPVSQSPSTQPQAA